MLLLLAPQLVPLLFFASFVSLVKVILTDSQFVCFTNLCLHFSVYDSDFLVLLQYNRWCTALFLSRCICLDVTRGFRIVLYAC